MRYLLDTHIIIWLITDNRQLKPAVRKILFDSTNQFYMSVESLREIVIKDKLNKSDFQILRGVTITEIATTLVNTLQIKLLSANLAHIDELQYLRAIHNDPFDHLLICQAIAENLTMISHDGNFTLYQSQGLALLKA
jgi:PIN domain nuclease of toxin-antitoxin system